MVAARTIKGSKKSKTPEQQKELFNKLQRSYENAFRQLFNDNDAELLDKLEEKSGQKNFGRTVLKTAVTEALTRTKKFELIANELGITDITQLNAAVKADTEKILREFAKLDGYEVRLRSHEFERAPELLAESLSWSAPVRVWRRDDAWRDEAKTVTGSHNANGQARPEYCAAAIDKTTGLARAEYLDPECLEANEFNLSAGRYKPFSFHTAKLDKTPAQVIEELQELEKQIQNKLAKLLAMVEKA